MLRRTWPYLSLLALAGCGGAGQSTTTAMPSMDGTMRSAGMAGATTGAEGSFKPAVGTNVPLGALKALAPKSPLAKPADGKADPQGAAKLAKLGKEPLKLDAAYSYTVADAGAPHATVGEKGASAPLPAEAKANPDGTYWVVDAETRRVFTLSGVKREEGKPATASEGPSADLVRPMPDAPVPPLALVARADEATVGAAHAFRILAKGVGAEGAPGAGARVRLKKTVSEKNASLMARSLLKTLKKYGARLELGEGAPALSALSDTRWTKEDEKAVAALSLADFELVAAPVPPKKAPEKSP